MDKIINWFEIPALHLERASAFYEQLLGVKLRLEVNGPNTLAIFPYNREQATGGCVIKGPTYTPASTGSIVYLHTGSDLHAALSRVQAAGGSIVVPYTALPPGMGAFAHVLDTEGNRVGLFGAN